MGATQRSLGLGGCSEHSSIIWMEEGAKDSFLSALTDWVERDASFVGEHRKGHFEATTVLVVSVKAVASFTPHLRLHLWSPSLALSSVLRHIVGAALEEQDPACR